MAEIHLLSWDYQQQLDLDALDRHVYNISVTGRPVRIQQVDTGSDEYAITISDTELSEWQRQEAYRLRWEGFDD